MICVFDLEITKKKLVLQNLKTFRINKYIYTSYNVNGTLNSNFKHKFLNEQKSIYAARIKLNQLHRQIN